MQGEVVETAIGEPVAIILGFLNFGDEADFGKIGDTSVYTACAASETGQFLD